MLHRKIYFYTLNDLQGQRYGSQEILTLFQALRTSVASAPYLQLEQKHLFSRCWIQKKDTFPLRTVWGHIRRSDFPNVERDGNLTPLVLQNPEDGLSEMTHATFFEDGIVGVEYNHIGPRIKTLRDYIGQKLRTGIIIKPIVDPDINIAADQIHELTRVEIAVESAKLEGLRTDNIPLFDSIRQMAQTSNAPLVSITVSAGHSREPLNIRMLRGLRRLIGREAGNEVIRTARVSGYDVDGEKIDNLDLLNEYIVSNSQVVTMTGSTRTVSSPDMFTKIARAKSANNQKFVRAINGDRR